MTDDPTSVMIYNRAAGRLEPEIVLGEGLMRLLYGNRAGGVLADVVLTRRFFSRLVGWLHRSSPSRRKIAGVAARLRIDLSECEKRVEEFTSFDDFFTRALRTDARPIDRRPEAVVSPCDARLLAFPAVARDLVVRVKGSAVSVRALVADERLAESHGCGTLLLYRLCPADYHRFHFPEDCVPGPAVRIAGKLHSVHPLALVTGRRILDTNLRERTILESRNGAGTIVMVEIGALCVGSIVQTFAPGVAARRGDEKGMFRFGGSTVAVLYEPGRVRVDKDILEHSAAGVETLVRVGMAVGAYVG
jgi:phosphatidylserine decarboxylase